MYAARGQPADNEMLQSFDKLCQWLEQADDELCSMDELHDKLVKITDTHTHTHNCFTALLEYVRDHLDEQVPER